MTDRIAHPDTESDRQTVPGRRAFMVGAGAFFVAACSGDEPASAPGATPSDAASPTLSPAPATDESAEPTATAEVSTETTEASAEPTPEPSVDPLTAAMFSSVAICALSPSAPAGPFPSRALLTRRDIHDGYPGHPLRLGIRVVDGDCQPVAGAGVDIWHTDASGDYSEYEDNGSGKDEGAGSTFCRGYAEAGDDGIAEFQTIYPGWYDGRAVHIHLTVHIDGQPVHTTQLYLDEQYTATVYENAAYAEFGLPDTPWADDGLIGDPASDGTGITLAPAETHAGTGTLGLVNVGVSR